MGWLEGLWNQLCWVSCTFFCDIHSYQCRLFQNVHLLRLEMSAATARTKCYTIEQQVSWAVMQHHMNASTRDQQKREGGRVRQQTPPTPLILIYKLIFHISLQNTINVIDIDLVERGCSLSSVYICATDMIYLDTHFCCIATAHHCEKVWVCVCVCYVSELDNMWVCYVMQSVCCLLHPIGSWELFFVESAKCCSLHQSKHDFL